MSGKEQTYEIERVESYKDLIERSCRLYGERPLFKFKKRMYKKGETPEFYYMTYNEAKHEMDCLGTYLNSLGLEDERVALLAKNRYEWMIIYYSVTIGNKVIVPLDKALPDNEIISLCERSEAKAIIFEPQYMDVIKKIKNKKLSNIEHFICLDIDEEDEGIIPYKKALKIGEELLNGGDRRQVDCEVDKDKISIMLFTSGTTSISKAVMLSQANVCANINDLASVIKFSPEDSTLALLPFHHAFQTVINHMLVYIGGWMSFCDGLKYIQQNLQEYKPTVMVSVPLILESIYKRIMKQVDKEGKTKLVRNMLKVTGVLNKLHIDVRRKVFKEIQDALGGNLRLIVSGAAPMDPQLTKDLTGFGFRIIQGYGLTETSPVLAVESDFSSRIGSVGKKLPSFEMKIINPDEKGIGEVICKGPAVMLGYYKNNQATQEAMIDGWYHTGDLGYIEDDYLFLTGRKKNVIVQKNGKNIFPEELEILIGYIPGVLENMVYGKPTKDNDLDVCVKIVYDEDDMKNIIGSLNEEEIYDYMKKKIKEINDKMPAYKHIRDIIITNEELIKTTTHKVKRHEEMKKLFNNK